MTSAGFVGLRDDRVARRLARAGWRVVACDDHAAPEAMAPSIVRVAHAVAVAKALADPPRVVWIDLPTGFRVELAIQDVWPEMGPGDIVVGADAGTAGDGARRAASLASARMHFVDCFVSDDLALTVGGSDDAIARVAPLLDLAGPWTHAGPPGSGYHAALRGRREGTTR